MYDDQSVSEISGERKMADRIILEKVKDLQAFDPEN